MPPRPLAALYDLPAPAKLNRFLHVVGRRADGYHLLQSVFVLIDWADTIHLERRADGLLRRHDLGPALPAEDLCLRAARRLQAESATPFGAEIHVDKRIPSGAGMGGGSSDAATVLLGLNRLWGLGWSRSRLSALGQALGADVPFFVGGRNALVEGIGERLTPVDVPVQAYAVVWPGQALPTADIFGDPDLKRDTEPVILSGSFEEAQLLSEPTPRVGEWGRNDLQPPAEARCPAVAQAARWLEARYGNSRMTGSGSAVFSRAGAIDRHGVHPMATFPAGELPPGWVGRMCRGLPGHPLVRWAG